MIKSMTWTAPAGDLGLGAADVRADRLAAVRMAVPAAPRPGTGVPTAARLRGPIAGVVGVVAPNPCSTSSTDKFHNGTTLGIHSPGRPLS